MSSTFIHIVANNRISFLFKAAEYSIICIYHILFIHLSINGHLECFHFLAIVNSAAMNVVVQISQDPAFNSFGYILRNGITSSYDSSVFNFLRSSYTVFIAVAPFYHLTNSVQTFIFLNRQRYFI